MIPDDVVDEAARLSRRAREAEQWADATPPDGGTYDGPTEPERYRERRDALLDEHGYVARVREDDDGATLVCHPADWLDDEGTVRMDRVDVEAGVEVALDGVGDADAWREVAAHNRAVAAAVAADHGDPHGSTARALADFASNHYAKRVEALTPAERREFVTEYFPRNAWPTADQRAVVEESVELACERAATVDAE
jgi:hypothetical protein